MYAGAEIGWSAASGDGAGANSSLGGWYVYYPEPVPETGPQSHRFWRLAPVLGSKKKSPARVTGPKLSEESGVSVRAPESGQRRAVRTFT